STTWPASRASPAAAGGRSNTSAAPSKATRPSPSTPARTRTSTRSATTRPSLSPDASAEDGVERRQAVAAAADRVDHPRERVMVDGVVRDGEVAADHPREARVRADEPPAQEERRHRMLAPQRPDDRPAADRVPAAVDRQCDLALAGRQPVDLATPKRGRD